MEEMKKENAKLAAAGGAGGGDSSLEEMLAAKQAELQVQHVFATSACAISGSALALLLLRRSIRPSLSLAGTRVLPVFLICSLTFTARS